MDPSPPLALEAGGHKKKNQNQIRNLISYFLHFSYFVDTMQDVGGYGLFIQFQDYWFIFVISFMASLRQNIIPKVCWTIMVDWGEDYGDGLRTRDCANV